MSTIKRLVSEPHNLRITQDLYDLAHKIHKSFKDKERNAEYRLKAAERKKLKEQEEAAHEMNIQADKEAYGQRMVDEYIARHNKS